MAYINYGSSSSLVTTTMGIRVMGIRVMVIGVLAIGVLGSLYAELSTLNSILLQQSRSIQHTVTNHKPKKRNDTSNSNNKLIPSSSDISNSSMPRHHHNNHVGGYIPASSEQYISDHTIELGFDSKTASVPTCTIWKEALLQTAANKHEESAMQQQLSDFRQELATYSQLVRDFEPVGDLRLQIAPDESNLDQVCQQVELHPAGLSALFPSGQLSISPAGEYMEPLLPPLRHPEFCFDPNPKSLYDLQYLIHDFGAMCHKLKRTSRTVLVDMGASLDFHEQDSSMPAVYLTQLYERFGFTFDHVYAYEVTPTSPAHVFETVPAHLLASYHWINVGVSADPDSRLNPLKLILDNFNEDDIIIVKLDIDTAELEVSLAHQLLEDDRYHALVDQFYFEHHVQHGELAPFWATTMKGSFKDSLDLFSSLREKGIPAHSWV